MLVSAIAGSKLINTESIDPQGEVNLYQFIVGSIQAFVSIALFAFTYIITRYLKHMKSDEQQFLSSTCSLIILFAVFVSQEPDLNLIINTWIIGIVSGIFSFIVSMTFIRANSLINASKVASLDFI